jgi:gas vesicle protein
MSFISTPARLLAVMLFTSGAAVYAAESAPKPGEAKASATDTLEKAKKSSSTDAKKLVEQLSVQRDNMIAEYEKLAKQLADATEEQKKVIKGKMEAQKKAFEEATSALHKQIIDERRRQRQNNAPRR